MSVPETSVNPGYNMLLTSAGATTEAIQERLLEMTRGAGRLGLLRVVMWTDGLAPFGRGDEVSRGARAQQLADNLPIKLWSSKIIRHVLGNVLLFTQRIGRLEEERVEASLRSCDLVLAPGGNTHLLASALGKHRASIENILAEGKPYVGESAGSIVTGLSTLPAEIDPADPKPHPSGDSRGLGLVKFDVVPHAPGREGGFEVPGAMAKVASRALRAQESTAEAVEQFVNQRSFCGVHVETLHDKQALVIQNGEVNKI